MFLRLNDMRRCSWNADVAVPGIFESIATVSFEGDNKFRIIDAYFIGTCAKYGSCSSIKSGSGMNVSHLTKTSMQLCDLLTISPRQDHIVVEAIQAGGCSQTRPRYSSEWMQIRAVDTYACCPNEKWANNSYA